MKKDFKFYFAQFSSKCTYGVIKLVRIFKKSFNGSFYPGKIALKFDKDFLGKIEKPEKIICITGTNGKTTTANMVIDALEKNGFQVLNNKLGSNIQAGIACALSTGATITGKTKYDIAVFEVDERSSIKVYPYIEPTIILCTNLFRDSMKRNAHPEFILDIINQGLEGNTTTKFILNADDLISCQIAPENKNKVYFGMDALPTDTTECHSIVNDFANCPKCGSKLKYNYLKYHHIGNAFCPNCDFRSPEAKYLGTNFDFKKLKYSMIETLKDGKKQTEYSLITDNIVNIYNQIAATACLKEFGLSEIEIRKAFEDYKLVESRYTEEDYNGLAIKMMLAKGQNAVACSRVFDYIKTDSGNKAVMLNLDDFYDAKTSSENICWLYDTDYELLNDPSIKQICIAGKRRMDHYMRCLIAGIPKEKLTVCEYEYEEPAMLNFNKIDKIFILHDVYTRPMAMRVKENIKEQVDIILEKLEKNHVKISGNNDKDLTSEETKK